MSKKGKNASSAFETAEVNVGRQTIQANFQSCGPTGKVFISSGCSKVHMVKVIFEKIICSRINFFNPTTPSIQTTLCYKFSRTICRDFPYELQKTPVVPIDVNSNALLVKYIIFKTAD